MSACAASETAALCPGEGAAAVAVPREGANPGGAKKGDRASLVDCLSPGGDWVLCGCDGRAPPCCRGQVDPLIAAQRHGTARTQRRSLIRGLRCNKLVWIKECNPSQMLDTRLMQQECS